MLVILLGLQQNLSELVWKGCCLHGFWVKKNTHQTSFRIKHHWTSTWFVPGNFMSCDIPVFDFKSIVDTTRSLDSRSFERCFFLGIDIWPPKAPGTCDSEAPYVQNPWGSDRKRWCFRACNLRSPKYVICSTETNMLLFQVYIKSWSKVLNSRLLRYCSFRAGHHPPIPKTIA